MTRFLRNAAIVWLVPLFALFGSAAAQDSITAPAGTITLTIDSATTGGDPDASLSADGLLQYTSSGAGRIVSAQVTDLQGPVGLPLPDANAFYLTVEVLSPSNGSAYSLLPQTLRRDAAVTLIDGIGASAGPGSDGATLRYLAHADVSVPTGTYTFTVTYTLIQGTTVTVQ